MPADPLWLHAEAHERPEPLQAGQSGLQLLMGQVEALFAKACMPDQETRLTVQLLNHACQLQVSLEACKDTVHSCASWV